MLTKAILVLIYFVLVFLVAKILDLSSSWLELGCVASPLFNPFALSVRRLKALLDERGISYVGVVDKSELAQLVKDSGSFNAEDSCIDVPENENDEEITHFRSSSHLYEKIEDTKASGWLVQIIPQYRTSLLSLKQWRKLSKKVTLLGIQTGVFDCSLEPHLCARNGWDTKCLLLSSPRGQTAKGNVMIDVYTNKPSIERAFSWLNAILATRVRRLQTHKEYLKYLKKDKSLYDTTKIVLFGQLEEPPALLSSLSIKFTGRVHFAYFKITKENADDIRQKIGFHKRPGLLVVTPERRFFYGTRKGEVLRYRAMKIFLTNLHPEVNDIFLLALILVNQLAALELFLTPGGVLRKLAKFFLFVGFGNAVLIVAWLPLVYLFRLGFTQSFLNIGLKACRFITDSNLLSLIRYNFLTYSRTPMWFALGFCMYAFCVNMLKKRLKFFRWAYDGDDDDISDWFYQDLVYFRRFFHSFRSTRGLSTNIRSNEDNLFIRTYEDIIIQRLATPDLWLRPLMPTDFVKDLPVWKNCDCPSPTNKKPKSNKEKLICDLCQWKYRPEKILLEKECVICLEVYVKDCIMVSVPCRHVFHQTCLETWFKSGNHCKNYNCPVCRWPAYKAKAEILDIPDT